MQSVFSAGRILLTDLSCISTLNTGHNHAWSGYNEAKRPTTYAKFDPEIYRRDWNFACKGLQLTCRKAALALGGASEVARLGRRGPLAGRLGQSARLQSASTGRLPDRPRGPRAEQISTRGDGESETSTSGLVSVPRKREIPTSNRHTLVCMGS